MAAHETHSDEHTSLTHDQLELIAALIDGRLRGRERTDVLRLFADSERALQVLADTVLLLCDTEPGAPVSPPVAPSGSLGFGPATARVAAGSPWVLSV